MTADNIKEMMDNFNKVQEAARNQFPNASDEEIYEIVSAAMNKSLGL